MKKILRSLYDVIPFKKQIFISLKKLGTPARSLYRHLHFKGNIRVYIDKGKKESFRMMHYGYEIENELFWKGISGGWEKVSLGLWMQLCRVSGSIFDIGANTGVYALVAKTVNPSAAVYAFEPVQRVFEKLSRNCNLNHYNINCYQKAVSNYSGKAIIYDTSEEHILSVTVNKNLQDPSREVVACEIATTRLDEMIEENKIDKMDLVKIDVETHEPEVLEGFGIYLQKFKPTMLIEVLTDEVGEKIERLIAGMGYLYFNIDEDNGLRQVNKIGQSDYYNYLLCNKQIAHQLNLSNQ